MGRYNFVVLALAAWFSACACSKTSQAEGWDWNPFATSQDSKEATTQFASTSTPNSKSWWPEWKAPSMPWSTKKPTQTSSYPKKTPTTWQKMSKTTKRWWAKTADVLDPYPDPKPTYASKQKSSTFGNWFGGDDPQKIETVTDYLGQKRID